MVTLATLKNSITDALQTDSSIDLMNYIKTNWDNPVTFTTVLKASVNFDTKWFVIQPAKNQVIIEHLKTKALGAILGSTRYAYLDTKRIQIVGVGPSAINNRYAIEQRIDDLVNGNSTGMMASAQGGYITISLSDFGKIETRDDAAISEMEADPKAKSLSRSWAFCQMYYEKYSS